MKNKLSSVAIGILACCLIGCDGSAPTPPAPTSGQMAQRVDVAKKIVDAVESAPPLQRRKVLQGYHSGIRIVTSTGDQNLISRLKKALGAAP